MQLPRRPPYDMYSDGLGQGRGARSHFGSSHLGRYAPWVAWASLSLPLGLKPRGGWGSVLQRRFRVHLKTLVSAAAIGVSGGLASLSFRAGGAQRG